MHCFFHLRPSPNACLGNNQVGYEADHGVSYDILLLLMSIIIPIILTFYHLITLSNWEVLFPRHVLIVLYIKLCFASHTSSSNIIISRSLRSLRIICHDGLKVLIHVQTLPWLRLQCYFFFYRAMWCYDETCSYLRRISLITQIFLDVFTSNLLYRQASRYKVLKIPKKSPSSTKQ